VRSLLAVILWGLATALAHAAPVRFIDAATRFLIESPSVEAVDGQLTIAAPGYRARSLPAFPDDGVARFVVLEPEQPPSELQPDTIAQLHRVDATVVLGYVGDAVTGRPLAGVSVTSGQGTTVETDERGYFQIYLSCESDLDRGTLGFQKSGFQTQRRTDVELFPFGDWIYRIQLHPGEGAAEFNDKPARMGVSAELVTGENAIAASATPINAVIPRVPVNIRISHTNGIYYETLDNYCKHSLPAEWIASWGAYTGGSNSLNAGAVAVRTYAVGYVNSPRGADHDICASTSCQVYNPTLSNSRTDLAVDFTSGCVMINANNAIPRGLTEYSAENNQLGMPCGDGFTAPTGGCLADPVCTGESEFGHGRGLCQWGSARWATGLKFPNRSTTDNTTTNGHPRQDWEWILNHYYPNLRLVRAAPLALNHPVRVIGTTTPLNVRSCPGGTITNGVNCPSLGSQPLGSLGYITAGPQRITADGQGYTWWKVRWQNGAEGWSVENYLDRFIPTNSAPTITGVADLALHAGMALRMTNSATDADFPPNTLTFSLLTAPPGTGIHPSTGYLLWTLTATNVGTTNLFTVRVTDDGSPPLSATNSFRVRIIPPPQVSTTQVPSASVRLTWTSAVRSRYRVEYAGNLASPTWLPLGKIITATATTTTFTDTPAQQRFYRIVVID
jgi:hypothetical protein